MVRCALWCLSTVAVVASLPVRGMAQQPAPASSAAAAQVREAVRGYDDALRRADSAAVERYWAREYTFINPRGEVVSRSGRLANLRSGRTALDSLVHAPQEEQIRIYGDLALYSTLLTIRGRYSGTSQEGKYRASVVWIRRDGRWQQLSSQMTPVLAPAPDATARASHGTEQQAKAMLQRAVVAMTTNKANALAMFNKGEGGFKDRDLYVFCANASDGILTAHPYLKGENLTDIVGKKGYPLGKEIMRSAVEGQIKQVSYWWPRPGSRRTR